MKGNPGCYFVLCIYTSLAYYERMIVMTQLRGEKRLLGVPAGHLRTGGCGGGRAVLLPPLQAGEEAGGEDGPEYLEQSDAHTQSTHVH